jgi:hypothetical protein
MDPTRWIFALLCGECAAIGAWCVHRYRSDPVGNAEQRDRAITFFAMAGASGLVLLPPRVVLSSGLLEALVVGSMLVLLGIALFNMLLIYGQRAQRKRTTRHGGHEA